MSKKYKLLKDLVGSGKAGDIIEPHDNSFPWNYDDPRWFEPVPEPYNPVKELARYGRELAFLRNDTELGEKIDQLEKDAHPWSNHE